MRVLLFKKNPCPPCDKLYPLWLETVENNKNNENILFEVIMFNSRDEDICDLCEKYDVTCFPCVTIIQDNGIFTTLKGLDESRTFPSLLQ